MKTAFTINVRNDDRMAIDILAAVSDLADLDEIRRIRIFKNVAIVRISGRSSYMDKIEWALTTVDPNDEAALYID